MCLLLLPMLSHLPAPLFMLVVSEDTLHWLCYLWSSGYLYSLLFVMALLMNGKRNPLTIPFHPPPIPSLHIYIPWRACLLYNKELASYLSRKKHSPHPLSTTTDYYQKQNKIKPSLHFFCNEMVNVIFTRTLLTKFKYLVWLWDIWN